MASEIFFHSLSYRPISQINLKFSLSEFPFAIVCRCPRQHIRNGAIFQRMFYCVKIYDFPGLAFQMKVKFDWKYWKRMGNNRRNETEFRTGTYGKSSNLRNELEIGLEILGIYGTSSRRIILSKLEVV